MSTTPNVHQGEIPLLEFCKNSQREQTMSTMSTQHASAVGMIWVMDSIPWVRCASGNVWNQPHQGCIKAVLRSAASSYCGLLFKRNTERQWIIITKQWKERNELFCVMSASLPSLLPTYWVPATFWYNLPPSYGSPESAINESYQGWARELTMVKS